ncbi:MAG: hypothetical protein JWN61_100, partial [Pseudonocardiales bacterium]|nr:hypothetical protein [Pseudonocardiales bacterium]
VVMPESSWQFWSREVWRTSRVGRPDRITNQSWTGDLARLGVDGTLSKALWLLGGAAVIAVALIFARRAEGWWPMVRILVVAAAASTFASPISWTHHYWWAVPAVAALLYRAVDTRSAAAIGCFATVFAMFALGPLKLAHMVHSSHWASAISGDLYLYASVLTCIGLCAPTRRTAPTRLIASMRLTASMRRTTPAIEAELSVVGAADVDGSRGEQAHGERSREHQHTAD